MYHLNHFAYNYANYTYIIENDHRHYDLPCHMVKVCGGNIISNNPHSTNVKTYTQNEIMRKFCHIKSRQPAMGKKVFKKKKKLWAVFVTSWHLCYIKSLYDTVSHQGWCQK